MDKQLGEKLITFLLTHASSYEVTRWGTWRWNLRRDCWYTINQSKASMRNTRRSVNATASTQNTPHIPAALVSRGRDAPCAILQMIRGVSAVVFCKFHSLVCLGVRRNWALRTCRTRNIETCQMEMRHIYFFSQINRYRIRWINNTL